MIDFPNDEILHRIAAANHFTLSGEELRSLKRSIAAGLPAFERLDAITLPQATQRYPRAGGSRPCGEENLYGAWAWKASVSGAASGPLQGKKVAIKDNVAVAGMPLRNGSPLLDGFVPKQDSTVVTRILDAGGEIVGKAACENLCFSGGSHTSYPEAVRNPRSPAHMAGGSSSGSAALIAAGQCDMAIGGDQGGSIRIPSAWCGIFGLKPTWGLVPYTGAFPIEPSIDHLGPMAASVRDVALLLDAIAGRDGSDPRQLDTPFESVNHVQRLEQSTRGMRIGVLREGFATERADPQVDAMVRLAAGRFDALECTVTEVSVPMHAWGLDIWSGIATEGAWSTMVRDNSMGHGSPASYDLEMIRAYSTARRERGGDFSATVKQVILMGQYLDERYGGHFYAKAQNLRSILRAAYDAAFAEVDLLVMPTTPQLPPPLPPAPNLDEYLDIALNMMANTATFDATGHPAMSVPCGRVGDLPVGMMLVGPRFGEAAILRAAYSFEREGWASLR